MLSEHLCECGKCQEYTPIATKTDSRRGQVKGQPIRFVAGHNSMVSLNSLQVIDNTPVELDELKIRSLRSMSDADAAKILDERLRALETSYKRNFVERGFILLEMEERTLWKHLIDPETGAPYTSFERWVVTAATHSRSDCFESLRAVKELRDVPREQLLEIPRKNIGVLSQLSTKVRRDPDVIAAAQTVSKKEFIGHIQANHPEQHIEQESKITVHPSTSARAVIDLALDVASWMFGGTSREASLEFVATYLLEGKCEKEGFEHLTNKEAFELAMGRGEVSDAAA